jgi:hypothetical protein
VPAASAICGAKTETVENQTHKTDAESIVAGPFGLAASALSAMRLQIQLLVFWKKVL